LTLILSVLIQATATSAYAQHSLLATINVLRSVIAAAAQVRTGSSVFSCFR
jgi:SIT family siderophore-iron:H+ symporter-like MFS transporter